MRSADPVDQRTRRVHGPWRFAFIIYAIALTIGTHWPRLQLGVGGVPAPDKIIHFTAFGGLACLLWMTGWIGRVSILLAVAIVWAAIDEMAQAIPMLGRSFSWWDIIAGWLGIVSVAMLIWASAPIGGQHNRMRLALHRFVFQELFTQPRTWILTALAGGLMSLVIGSCTGFLIWWYDPMEPAIAMMGGFAGAVAGGIAGLYAMLDAIARRSHEDIISTRPCFRCGSSLRHEAINEAGYGSCATCGTSFHLGQWLLRAELPRTTIMRPLGRAASIAATLVLIGAVVFFALAVAHNHLPSPLAAILSGRDMPADLRLMVDFLLFILLPLAVATRTFRRRIARVIDRQAERCRVCGHDVHATPAAHGVGRCGECGTVFVRL